MSGDGSTLKPLGQSDRLRLSHFPFSSECIYYLQLSNRIVTCDKETKAVESFTLPQGLRHNPNHAEQVGGLMLKSLGLSDRRLFFNSLMTIAEDKTRRLAI